MENTNSMTLDNVIGKYDKLSAQRFLDDMPYDFETVNAPEKYRINSPKKTIESGSAMCIDGALLAAALTGMRPNILKLSFANISHAVLIVQDPETQKFGAIGKSRRLDLTHRDCIYDNLENLAKSYKPTLSYTSIKWDNEFPDWLTTDNDMNSKKWPMEKRTKKFSLYYYLDSYFKSHTHK